MTTDKPRLPPMDVETEKALVGAMLLDRQSLDEVRAAVPVGDLATAELAEIFMTTCKLADSGIDVDLLSLKTQLTKNGRLEMLGGVDYLIELSSLGETARYNIGYYAGIIHEKAIKRHLLSLTYKVQAQAYSDTELAADIITGIQDALANGEIAPAIDRPAFMLAADLCRDFPTLREPIIDGLLRRSELGTVVGQSKLRKSYLLTGLGVAVATGQPWLGFPTRQGRVLILDFELHKETIAHRLPAVCQTYGVTPDDLEDRLAVEAMRGRKMNAYTLERYFRQVEPGRFDLIILDPLYKLLPADADENSNVQMANIFAELQGYAERQQAAMLLVHHLSKGDQSAKGIADLGSGAGSQSRAADAHLAIREHAEPDCAVLAGIIRSFPPFDPVALRWSYPAWQLAHDLDPADLKRTPPRRAPKAKEPPAIVASPYNAAWLAETVLTAEPSTRDAILALALEKGAPNRNQAKMLLDRAVATGRAFRWSLPKDNRAYFANAPQPKLVEGGE